MIRIKKYLFYSFVAVSFLFQNSGSATTIDKIKPIINRVGLFGKIEQNKEIKTEMFDLKKTQTSLPTQDDTNLNIVKTEKIEKTEINYTDFNINQLAKEIKGLLDESKPADLENLRILWQASVQRSETLRFAIYKLSNPNGEIEKKSAVKKILSPLAAFSPMIGAGTGSIITGSSAILGGSLLASVLSDDSFINNKLSKVTDTELVLLAQQTDNLQSILVKNYYDYKNSLEKLLKTDEMVKHRYEFYQATKNKSIEEHSIADVFYREATDIQFEARQEVLKTRSNLEQLVGNYALTQIEVKLKEDVSNNKE